ncbi:hypothetical protein HR12_04890 [Microbacterium sp. SUBG005]|nr:hypothetical protein HR12_04890 [Microbacterium sp. SUBG005]
MSITSAKTYTGSEGAAANSWFHHTSTAKGLGPRKKTHAPNPQARAMSTTPTTARKRCGRVSSTSSIAVASIAS